MKYLLWFLILMPIVYAVCEGCILNDECVEVGVQRLTEENGYEIYCGEDKVIYEAKKDGEVCNKDYECLSFYCDYNTCKTFKKIENKFVIFFFSGIGIFFIIALAITYFIYRLKSKKKKVKLVAKDLDIKKIPTKKIIIRREDPLEKNIKESLRMVSSLFKKRKP